VSAALSNLKQLSILAASREKTLVKTGKSIFEVIWSVTVSSNDKLSSAKIGSIEFVETLWEDA
jgi:hypothetical protein